MGCGEMYLVLDIGGTFVKYATMNLEGELLSKGRKPIAKDDLNSFCKMLFSVIEEHDLNQLEGIAMSCPGAVDPKTGIIYHGGSFPFLHEVNLVEIIQNKYQLSVTIENDAKCAALAELWLGSIKDKKDAIVLILGSAIGGGIIIDGKLHRGASLSAGEVSYINHRFNPETKEVGYFGLDCSAVEMVKKIAKLKNLKDETDGEAVFEYINSGDEQAMEVFDTYCNLIAIQILNLHYVIDPELIAIGGGISAQPILIERINQAIDEIKKVNDFHVATPHIVACHFLNDANLYGALYHFEQSRKEE